MYVGIIGLGVVGSALFHNLKNCIYIKDTQKIKCMGNEDDLMKTDIVFVCVPTPTLRNGSQDIDSVLDACSFLHSANYRGVVAIKSTVLPGTMDYLAKKFHLRLVHNPEFLTARSASEDIVKQPIVLSGPVSYVDEAVKFYINHTNCTGEPYGHKKYIVTEWAKYIHNSILPVKLSFLNEIHSAINDQENYKDACIMAELYGNLGSLYEVPGPDGKMGWGGECFPKDTKALAAKYRGLTMLRAARRINKRLRK